MHVVGEDALNEGDEDDDGEGEGFSTKERADLRMGSEDLTTSSDVRFISGGPSEVASGGTRGGLKGGTGGSG